MSLLLETHKNDIPSSYMALFPHLLQPVLWERTGNIPALVRLLQAFLERGSSTIATAAADKIVSPVTYKKLTFSFSFSFFSRQGFSV
jgi:exportin-2 (importin alpha re-exporter)